ncbi:MAG: DNA-binding response regulator [Cytophagales bacterium]|nr:MAG: DNA-binding response regulator [Cytophagales bacterium]
MHIVLLEDEPLAAKALQKLLQAQLPNDTIIHLSSLENAQVWFAQNPTPDLIFADIQLSDGVSFELFETETPPQCPIIFTTAYNEYALRAFKLNSIDYLLKPIDAKELQHALQKWSLHTKSETQQNDFQTRLQHLILNLQNPTAEKPTYKERFLVQAKNVLMPLQAAQIACFQKEEIIFIHTHDHQKYIADQHSLEELEELLNPALFIRANRQFIVHIDNVQSLKATHKGAEVQLKSPKNTKIDISREKVQNFKNWLQGGDS